LFSILDIGTGSGCIPVALAKNSEDCKLSAIDVSAKALEIAKKNAVLNKVEINFLEFDILQVKSLPQQYDIIVSNPPYVRELEKIEIQNNVLQNEPHLALFVSNENPLIFYEKIIDLARQNLTKNGFLFFEINQYLGKETVGLLTKKGFKTIELRKDIFGNDRMIKAKLC
jgi:release factor glutamine methyltransferase